MKHYYWESIWEVYRREFKRILADINITLVVLISPLLYSFFCGPVYFNKAEQEIPIVVVDQDRSELSRTLVRYLDAHKMIKVTEIAGDLPEIEDDIHRLKTEGFIYIANSFSKSLKSGQAAELLVCLNTSRFLVSNDLNLAITEVALTMSSGVKIKYFQANGLNFNQALPAAEPLSVDLRSLFNSPSTYGDFILRGLLMLIIQQTMLIGLAESVAKEREQNTISEWLNIAHNRPLAAITGKGLFYVILYSVYAAFFYIVLFRFFRMTITGSILSIALLVLLLLMAIVFIGILISSFFIKKKQALQFLAITSLPLFVLSGYSWPVTAMPDLIRWLAYLSPTTPFLSAFSRVTLMNAGIADIWPEIINLLILIGFYYMLVKIRLRKFATG